MDLSVAICWHHGDFLTCQRLIFRLYRGATPEKCDVTATASRTGCRHTHRYGNGSIAAQTTWPPEVVTHVLRLIFQLS
jgi:hypothetical protein